MTEFTYIPFSRVDYVRDDDLIDLLQDEQRLWNADILCIRREESWSPTPLYYVLHTADLIQVKEEAPRDLTELSKPELFTLLDIHETTRAEEVPVGEQPHRRAVALDAGGSVAGVWVEAEAEAGRTLAFPGPPSYEMPQETAAPPPVAANGGGGGAPPDGDEEAAERRGDEEAVEDPFFRRTPHIDLSAEEPLGVGEDFQALVYLDKEGARPGETVQETKIALPDDVETLDIEVLLAGTEHFEIPSESFKTLTVHRDDESSEKLSFDVHVREDAPLDQPAALIAYMTYNHRPAGQVRLAVSLTGAQVVEPPAEEETAPVAPDELVVDGTAIPADLTITVINPENDGRRFGVTLKTTLLDDFSMAEPEPWNFKDDTDVYVGSLMSQFTLKTASAADRQDSLEGAGIQLWEAAPKSFQNLLWRLIDAGTPPRTIFIVSQEPHIPWELMRPQIRRPDGTLEKREPLGTEFIVGRYVDPGFRSPKQNQAIDDSYVVAPTKYIRYRPLAHSAEEAKWVAERFGGTIVTPAVRTRLDEMLKERPVGLLHFIAHGKSDPNAPQLLVLDEDATFNSIQVRAMEGLENACLTKAPLVFLNACEVGRTTPSLVGAGGFASEFIRVGARAVVAPLWSVKDSLAHEVAVAFYQAALDKPERPFADILREIRSKSYAAGGGEDTYAAYCFYGDPLTSLQPPA
jgi:hypothetical protein